MKRYRYILGDSSTQHFFRPYRNAKTWAKTGRITNDSPKTEQHCTKLWDVDQYGHLVAHRNTKHEKNLPHQKLNYDHIPAKASIKESCNVKTLEGKDRQWWAIAIPEKLHKQGETFLVSSREQSEEGYGFLTNIQYYMTLLHEKPENFGLYELDECIKALGAFRYLYRCQVKEYAPIIVKKDEFTSEADDCMAPEPSHYFNEKESTDDIDNYFIVQLNRFANR